MKIRTGFVSNSSSSSFIIATESQAPIMRVEADISHLIETTLNTKEELDVWLIERCGYAGRSTVELIIKNDDYIKELYNDCLSFINQGKIVCIGQASNEGADGIETIIYNDGFPADGCLNFTVIQGCD